MFTIDYIDIINELSYRLPNFKIKQPGHLYNFRCPFCGDSKKSKYKARGYIYERKNKFFYKCHNCGLSISFSKFIKLFDEEFYKNLIYKQKINKEEIPEKFVAEIKLNEDKCKTIEDIEKLCVSVLKLPSSHPAYKIILKRKLPVSSINYLYYHDNFKTFIKTLLPDYNKELSSEPRIIIPFINENNKIGWLQGRSILKSNVKYYTVCIDPNTPKIYGLNKNPFQYDTVYVLEGPFDSMFFPNAIAVAGSDLINVINFLPKEKLIFVYDNEPDNSEICKKMAKIIEMGLKIVIWPKEYSQYGKDVNELIQSGFSINDIIQIINNNTFSGLNAEIKFKFWKYIK